jgi:hypothetical protein
LTSLDGLQNCPNLQTLYLPRSGVTSLAETGSDILAETGSDILVELGQRQDLCMRTGAEMCCFFRINRHVVKIFL